MPASRFSNLKFHREPCWRSYDRAPQSAVPQALRTWLLDRGSLTQRLIDASDNQFRVKILTQQMSVPRLSESRALGLSHRKLALVREVLLLGGNEPWVYARSILPASSLTGRLRKLRKLDNRPLGALLFSDPSMQRGPMEMACLTTDNCQLPDELLPLAEPIWGRRSVFFIDSKPLLVSEIFLPTFKPYNSPIQQRFIS